MSQKESGSKQMASVLKARTMEESEALHEKARIQSVLSGRQVELQDLVHSLNELKKEQEKIRSITRPSLLLRGENYRLPGLLKYDLQLDRRITLLEKNIREKKEDVSRAESRAIMAQDDLVGARMEKKRVELFLTRRARENQTTESARGEHEFDDLLGARRKK